MQPLNALSDPLSHFFDNHSEFTQEWWTWLIATGVFLALNISCKMVGLFMFCTIGSAVVIDLWNILDIRRGHSMVGISSSYFHALRLDSFAESVTLLLPQKHVAKHFFARAFALILVPAAVYMFWFWVHFKVLAYSGTGDDFMSPAFQETLIGSPLTVDAEGQ